MDTKKHFGALKMSKLADKDKKVRQSKGLTLNLIPSKEKCSEDEANRRLVDFFSLLFEWHLEDQKELIPPTSPEELSGLQKVIDNKED